MFELFSASFSGKRRGQGAGGVEPEFLSFSLGVPMTSSNCEFTNVCSYCTTAMVFLYAFSYFGHDCSHYADGCGTIMGFSSPAIFAWIASHPSSKIGRDLYPL